MANGCVWSCVWLCVVVCGCVCGRACGHVCGCVWLCGCVCGRACGCVWLCVWLMAEGTSLNLSASQFPQLSISRVKSTSPNFIKYQCYERVYNKTWPGIVLVKYFLPVFFSLYLDSGASAAYSPCDLMQIAQLRTQCPCQ